MADVVYSVAASVDGYIATPDGAVDWLAAFDTAGEDHGYAAFRATLGGVVMGRRTYDQVKSRDGRRGTLVVPASRCRGGSGLQPPRHCIG